MNTPIGGSRTTWTARESQQAHRAVQVRWYAGIALAAGAVTFTILVVLHIVMANEVRVNIDPVSVYALSRLGALLFGTACLAMAVACVAVLFGPVGAEPAPRWCLAGSAVALLFVVGFDTDAGATVSTISGYVHRYAAGTVFVLVTVAAAYIWRRLRVSGIGRAFAILTLINVVLLILNVTGTYLPDLANGGQWRGIPQRLLLLSQVVSIVLMAFVPTLPNRLPRPPLPPPSRLDRSWENKDWLTGRGGPGWSALPSANGF